MRVHVCIPHYVREASDPSANPHGYGSLRAGGQFQRSLALNRCLHSLLGLQRQAEITVLNIHHKRIDHAPANLPPLELQISVCTDGEHQLTQVLDLFGPRIEVVRLQPDNPRELPLACRDHLIANRAGADLLMYLEDDLVIHDPAFFDKQRWFLEKTEHRFSLMPHRYEPCIRREFINCSSMAPCLPSSLAASCSRKPMPLKGCTEDKKPCTSISLTTPIPDVSW